MPWPAAVNNTSPILSRTNSHNMSPLRQRNSDHSSSHASDPTGRALPLSSANRPSFGQMGDQASQSRQLDPVLASQGSNINSCPGFDDLRPSEERQQQNQRTNSFGGNAFISSAPSTRNYANSVSELAKHNNTGFPPTSFRTNMDMQTGTYFRPSAFPSQSNLSHHSASRGLHRPFHSTDASFDNNLPDVEDLNGSRDEDLASEMERLPGNHHLSHRSRSNHPPNFGSQVSYDASTDRTNFQSLPDERFSSGQAPLMPVSSPEHGFQHPSAYHRSTSFGNRASSSSSVSEARRELNSSVYSTASTPHIAPSSIRESCGTGLSSRASNGPVSLLEKKLRGLQPYQTEPQFLQPNPSQMRSSYQQQFDMPAQMPMNPLARPYAMPPYSTYSNIQSAPTQNPRYSRAEQELSHVIRSPLLEDYRTNNKTNKLYELKVALSMLPSLALD